MVQPTTGSAVLFTQPKGGASKQVVLDRMEDSPARRIAMTTGCDTGFAVWLRRPVTLRLPTEHASRLCCLISACGIVVQHKDSNRRRFRRMHATDLSQRGQTTVLLQAPDLDDYNSSGMAQLQPRVQLPRRWHFIRLTPHCSVSYQPLAESSTVMQFSTVVSFRQSFGLNRRPGSRAEGPAAAH